MPNETGQLRGKPLPLAECPHCTGRLHPTDTDCRPLMRGTVQRSKLKGWLWWGKPQPYCAVICFHCHEIVAWEDPDGNSELVLPRQPNDKGGSKWKTVNS